MKYWDSSALVVLHVDQAATAPVRDLFRSDPQILTWTLSEIEIRSALMRLAREGALGPGELQEAIVRVDEFWQGVHVVSLVEAVKQRARRLLGVHPLKAADSMQLAAALTAAYDDPRGQQFVCLDHTLSDAARREGFAVLP